MKKTAAISILLSTSLLFAACGKEEKKEEKQLEKPNTTEEVKTKEEPKKENEKPVENKETTKEVIQEDKDKGIKTEVKNEPKETPKQESTTKPAAATTTFTSQDALKIGEAFFAKESDLGISISQKPETVNNENYYKARLFSKSMVKDGGTGTVDHVYIGKNGVYDAYQYEETGKFVPYAYEDKK